MILINILKLHLGDQIPLNIMIICNKLLYIMGLYLTLFGHLRKRFGIFRLKNMQKNDYCNIALTRIIQ